MLTKFRNFLQDTGAAYGPLFAILTVPLFGTAAAAVEYSRLIDTKSNIQNALDAAALATAKEMSSSLDQSYLEQYARNFFDANLDNNLKPNDVRFGLTYGTGPTGGNTVKLTANYDQKTVMGKFIGVEDFEMEISATVAAGNRTVEVAIVLDNSGSMDSYTGSTRDTRIERAKLAAETLINSLHTVAALSNKPDPIKISVVPFGSSVNIGAQYRGAPWMDRYGWSSVHHENFDWLGTDTRGDPWPNAFKTGDGYKGSTTSTSTLGPNPTTEQTLLYGVETTQWLTRWTLFDKLGVDWAGCVEMRPWPYNVTDDTPDEMHPDTLIVPMFAPDEPDYVNRNEDRDYKNSYLNDYRRVGPDYPLTSYTSKNFTRQLWRQSWTAKYNSDAPWSKSEAKTSTRFEMSKERSRDFGDWGPNQGCTTDPVQKLTADKQTAINAVQGMDAGGYTNVQAGLVWGWRTLSPGEPFTEGRGYDVPENDKYIILLTDGNNTYPTQSTWNETEYYPWGYGKDERVMDGLTSYQSEVGAMNIHTEETCTNIKTIVDADNEPAYKIFTIAYDVANGSSVKDLLYNCASSNSAGKKYYYDVSGDAIASAMQAIGNEISDLRISQ